jgi:hypothetical protein
MTQGQRFLAFMASTIAVVLALAVLGPRLLGVASGPGAQIVTQLKQLEQKGFEFELPADAGSLRSRSLQYERMSVVFDDALAHATVTATLDFTGTLVRPGSGFDTAISSLGLESIAFELDDGEWVAKHTEAPRLMAIVGQLEARRRQVEQGDGGVRRRVYRAEAWFVRSEREEVLASEDWRLIDERGADPVDQKGTTRLSWTPHDGGSPPLP